MVHLIVDIRVASSGCAGIREIAGINAGLGKLINHYVQQLHVAGY